MRSKVSVKLPGAGAKVEVAVGEAGMELGTVVASATGLADWASPPSPPGGGEACDAGALQAEQQRARVRKKGLMLLRIMDRF